MQTMILITDPHKTVPEQNVAQNKIAPILVTLGNQLPNHSFTKVYTKLDLTQKYTWRMLFTKPSYPYNRVSLTTPSWAMDHFTRPWFYLCLRLNIDDEIDGSLHNKSIHFFLSSGEECSQTLDAVNWHFHVCIGDKNTLSKTLEKYHKYCFHKIPRI